MLIRDPESFDMQAQLGENYSEKLYKDGKY